MGHGYCGGGNQLETPLGVTPCIATRANWTHDLLQIRSSNLRREEVYCVRVSAISLVALYSQLQLLRAGEFCHLTLVRVEVFDIPAGADMHR